MCLDLITIKKNVLPTNTAPFSSHLEPWFYTVKYCVTLLGAKAWSYYPKLWCKLGANGYFVDSRIYFVSNSSLPDPKPLGGNPTLHSLDACLTRVELRQLHIACCTCKFGSSPAHGNNVAGNTGAELTTNLHSSISRARIGWWKLDGQSQNKACQTHTVTLSSLLLARAAFGVV